MAIRPKLVSVSIPEYTVDSQPDYVAIGAKIDKVLEENFEGYFLERVLSLTDHPRYNLDELVNIIIKTGTDKYDPNRKGVAHEQFEPYKPDLQAGEIKIHSGKLNNPHSTGLIKLFYENVLLDRGYRLRIDLILLYDPKQLVRAEKVDYTKPSVDPNLEQYLWRFKDPNNKQKALLGIIKILR
ncbi:hypothetical protein ACFL0Y_00930 [Patescibacteria group bacterium]